MTDVMINKEEEAFFAGKPEARALVHGYRKENPGNRTRHNHGDKDPDFFCHADTICLGLDAAADGQKEAVAQPCTELRLRAPDCA